MMQNQELLSIHNLGRQVSGRWLWRGVTFTLHPKERLALIAPSGAGKTLLMRSIVLLDPLQVGCIMLGGKSPAAWTLPVWRRRIMYLPQQATGFPGTVEENLKQVFQLAVSRSTANWPQDNCAYDRNRIITWLFQLGRSADFLGLQAFHLSGGEAQILALLRALQLDPQVLLLDEPTAFLDADTTDRLEMLLSTWLQDADRACMLISHDQQQIQRFTTRQLRLTEFN